MSSPKIKHFLNNVCSLEGLNYLEIGLGSGSTHIAALYQNKIKSFGMDIWLDKKVSPFGGKKGFFELCNKHIENFNSKIHSGDCFKTNLEKFFDGNKIDVYFYDGDHSEEAHYNAIRNFYPYMSDTFILIIDDSNDQRVTFGTDKGLKKMNFEILFQKRLPGQLNTTKGVYGDIRLGPDTGWWNGLWVLVLKKKTS